MMSKQEKDITIENLCALVKSLFCEMEISNVIHGDVYYDGISCEQAAGLAVETQRLYERCSELECQKRAEAISDAMWRRDRHRMRLSHRGKIHVFELLADLAECLLVMQNGEVLCRYTEILSWRELIQSIGEEIPVSAMYAICDLAAGKSERTHFTWNFVARQNNEPLNTLLRRGISEHHMHLWPSVPYFHVSWLNLMNHPLDGAYVKNLDKIDERDWIMSQRARSREGNFELERETAGRSCALVTLCRQAALIRLYLCEKLKGYKNTPLTIGKVLSMLTSPESLYINSDVIQGEIAFLRSESQKIDYMLQMFHGQWFKGQEEYTDFSGERWFLYSVIRDIYLTEPVLGREDHNLFYAYLLIMIRLRVKLVEANQRVGFDYFQRIEKRKGYFLGDAKSKKLIMNLAIHEPLKRAGYLREMEVRISPRVTADQIRQDILELDGWETDGQEGSGGADRDRYYYILHFTKRADAGLLRIKRCREEGRSEGGFEYRHFGYRQTVEKTTRAIIHFRERYSDIACRVLGIDACSQEIGCRPEVFATAFRTLGEHTCFRDVLGEQDAMPGLRKTYHVGEDFLDLTDGLRAIDEAIHFLGYDCGDRLGHALALCLEPLDWYSAKKMQISLPVQDYIDNTAWLYYAIRKYRIPQQEQVIHFLEKEFEYYFNRVYLSNISERELESVMDAAVKYYQNNPEASHYRKHDCHFSIELYCRAWMLRGDHPDLYREGYFKRPFFPLDDWERHSVNRAFPHDAETRYIPECSLLYYFYHYSEAVKYAGMEIINVPINHDYIKALKAVQHELQLEIARRGLSIESNPTSNAKISTFREYSKHPIVALYNKGLFHSPENLRSCAQINVSINTDDSGVFFTSLENEYAVMARALESISDPDGKPAFYTWEVYDWLEQIRLMGNEQGFAR